MTGACTQGVDTGFVALGYGKVALLGLVQGITELLPISSTAHMRIVPALLGWQDPGSAFSAAMQLAALTAVVSYFWSDVSQLATNSLRAVANRDFRDRHFRFSVGILLATIPIGIACIVMAVLLALAEIFARHRRTLENTSAIDAMIVGIAQIGALIPGVSRSGSTLTAALALGLKRDEAARFSFLLGLPAIALAGFKELWELHKVQLSADGWSLLLVGLVVASISAFCAIWGLMRVLERFSAWPFVIYRGVLGIVLIWAVALGYFT